MSSRVPLALTGALTLTATTNSAGALPNSSSGNCCYVVATAVGARDIDESVISAVSNQVAIAGSNNALHLAISGNVPTPAPTKVRIFRTLFGGASTGPYYFDQDVVVTTAAGVAWPGVVATLTKSDSELMRDETPPSFLCAIQTPEAAFCWAAAFASAPPPSPRVAYIPGPILLATQGMLNPWNVALNPANQWIGLGNNPAINAANAQAMAGQASTAFLGLQVLGTGFTAGTILQANNALSALQGFAGAYGGGGTAAFEIQARAIGMLNGSRHSVISYSYYDVNHPGSNIQTAAGVVCNSDFVGGVQGEIITYPVTAGRVPVAVTAETTGTGTATTGTYIWEAQPARTI